MSRVRQIKTTFTSGEVSRRLLGRGDLKAYENGALSLRNLFIHPTGGISRRAGMYYVDTVSGTGRLIDFEFNTEQTYLLVLTDLQMDVYQDGIKITTLVTPWAEAQISQLSWTQSEDTLLLTHPDVEPQKLTRSGAGVWALDPWAFFIDDAGNNRQPYFKFAKSDVSLTPNGTTGTITLTASADVFNPLHAGTRLRVAGKDFQITSYASPTVVEGNLIDDLDNTNATTDWQEQSFSSLRGWPISVAFHQDRLVIGGSRDLPNRLWFSKSGDIWNFDLGEGLDDEAIEFAILSDQVNAIRAIFSGRHLQVLQAAQNGRLWAHPLRRKLFKLIVKHVWVRRPIARFCPLMLTGRQYSLHVMTRKFANFCIRMWSKPIRRRIYPYWRGILLRTPLINLSINATVYSIWFWKTGDWQH
jgi:hypothetical protein